ncbi:2Fe-2S iron-sulfur cluster binding domain-containing protein [Bacillus sp. EB600]|uniref:2Fe-2S iron-sulfur cluster-binding protein n=1 Tax=Bacillus sp. EB600 TaxID=2806345 RepID=UPI00210C78B0|nr:2Fe-2S iron-sulfur cluster binding domain-containing protein [Bacillus sp. EB600]MCQ6278781.1 2Fe-2S iron-sulfur cluster binding domain-containing protein [Bacillus sp. EB600]
MDNRVWTVGSLIPGSIKLHTVLTPNRSRRELPYSKNIILQQNEKSFEIRPAKGKLLDAALNQGNELSYKCRKGTCGLCSVKIVENGTGLSKPNEKEKEKLKAEINNGFRLACQAEILL